MIWIAQVFIFGTQGIFLTLLIWHVWITVDDTRRVEKKQKVDQKTDSQSDQYDNDGT